MKASSTARIFLALNATFSLAIGGDLLVASGSVSEMIFSGQHSWLPLALRILGAGLLMFACVLFLMASNRFITKMQVLVITMMDVGWVIASAGLLFMIPEFFTDTGQSLVSVVAAVVAIFAVGQYVGSGRIIPTKSQVSMRSEKGRLIATVRRAVNAPSHRVWEVMTDHPGYADVASNLSKVEVLSGHGVGMERRCYGRAGESWRETCDLYEDGKTYAFNVHTEEKSYPYPISELRGRWSVKEGDAGSEFNIVLVAKPKGNFIKRWLFVLAAKRQFSGVLIDLADAWSSRMEHEAKT
ncbi:polyketide cyclase/dehydrase/lipid transport protein [Marinimicrobium koreense]|uniref:Polyketide cyclase/dehydrase/lipid transport protein n=1 Tax=Marinimicrobium koreense TaxID=306545 RepID=A0A3N1NZD4_9GAMM|nr:SRPBCC family protein [Marinimicrobium koreense]ROQ21555.1 polyketide cyclase/dehydrase/lipid transport protein [Marinimicrobium koreense]